MATTKRTVAVPAALRPAHASRRPRSGPRPDPIDIMLATMQWAHEQAKYLQGLPADPTAKDGGPTGRLALALRALALSAAKDAAPYLHLRRAARESAQAPGSRHEDALAELAAEQAET